MAQKFDGSKHRKPLGRPRIDPELEDLVLRLARENRSYLCGTMGASGVKEEALSKLILFGEWALRHALKEYTSHFHEERSHQGKGNVMLFSTPVLKTGMMARLSAVNDLAGC